MYVLVYAAHGIVGEDDSKVVVTDTLEGAQWEMHRQVREYVEDNDLEPLDCSYDVNDYGIYHATADLSEADGPEWHIYEV